MSRISRIVELGIEDLTTQLYDQHRSFSEVAQELNRRNYQVSMVQVRTYLTSLPPKAISLTDTEPEYTEITRSPRSADADEMETFPPISQLVPYNQKAEGHSIFDVVENLDQDHNYLVRLLESDQNTTIDTSLIHVDLNAVWRRRAVAAGAEEVSNHFTGEFSLKRRRAYTPAT